MAAEILLTFATEETLKKLGSVVIDDVTRIWGLKKDLKKLKRTIESIQDILRKAEDNQETVGVKDWLMELQEVVYSADDVLDEFSYEILRRKIEIGEQPKHKVLNFFCCYYNPLSFRAKMAYKVKKINNNLADLKEQAMSKFAFGVAAGVDPRGAPSTQPDLMGTDSFLDESKPLVGRTEELNNIITFLEANSSSRMKIVSIVGFGGLGKTTLAKLVHEQVKRKNLFDVTVWVDVSITSKAADILGEMLQKVEGSPGQHTNIDTIRGRLREKLENKRFLLVLDNVWSRLATDWKSLEGCLSQISGSNGNSVIMTTRNLDLAAVMENNSLHLVELQQLKDKECWSIIKRMCEKGEGSVIPEDLKSIGFDIARKCKGVPLVAEVLGGTLCSKKDRKEWLSIRDSNVWESVGTNNILPVLRLSFDRLRSPIKQCFAYCSLYPKNYVFDKGQLIQQWMAEGFLHATSGNAITSKSSMEEIGDEFFNDLRGNSFFQDVGVDKWGHIISCKMHDLLHDLAISVSNRTMLNQDDGSSSYTFRTHDCRWVSFLVHGEQHPSFEDFVKDCSKELRSLHTNIAVFHTWINFKRLRSLNLYGANCNELPTAIGVLKHLRYLDISMNFHLQVLPESITKLYNLQTLRVINCDSLKELPSKIGNLVSLRHIHFNNHNLVPFKVGSLTNLRTLPLFVVGQEVGYEIQELKQLNELRGKLKIFNLQHVRNGTEALAANLRGKKLSKVRLIWQRDAEREDSLSSRNCNHEEVLEGLQPPESIMSFTIVRYMSRLFPEWMSMKVSSNGGSQTSLNQLAKLKLLSCEKCEIMPTLGHLPRLKILEIEEMKNVRRIGNEFYGESKGDVKLFPALEILKLCKMESLEEWEAPDEQRTLAFPSLQKLQMVKYGLLKTIPLSHLFSLEIMKIELCLKLMSLPMGLTSLEDLSVKRCLELESISSSQDLVSLKRMKIVACPKLTSLPMGLTSLEDLTIKWCADLESISNSEDLLSLKRMIIRDLPKLTSLPKGLKSLEELEIYNCINLESISSLQDLASLKIMKIWPCAKLTSLPQGLKSLQHLRIDGINNLLADAFRGLSSLEILEIQNIGNLELMPSVEELTSLKTLRIEDCGNLTALPVGLHLLKCLEMLSIHRCHKITAISPEIKSCTSLKRLFVSGCRGLTSFETDIISSLLQLEILSLGNFSYELVEFPGFDDEIRAVNNTSLKYLTLMGWDNMKSLPYLGHLTALKDLEIWHFGISELPIWLGKLSSLEELRIWNCESLISLSASMRQLSKLKILDIWGCPLLEKKFEEDRSAFWPNISHIAYIRLGIKVIQDKRF